MTRLPDFIGIGTQRSGTTWLHQHLQRHPRIWLPPVKEVHYFDSIDPTVTTKAYRYSQNVRRRAKHYLAYALRRTLHTKVGTFEPRPDPAWDFRYFAGKQSNRWYQRLFVAAKTRGLIVGEITPGYCKISPETIDVIRALNPEIKIILVMRDPIDRTWSQLQKAGTISTDTFSEDRDDEKILQLIRKPEVFGYSDYATILDRWQSAIRPENLFVGYFEDMREDPARFLRSVIEFLGAGWDPAMASPDLRRAVNTSRGGAAAIPHRIERALAETYEPMLRSLAQHGHPRVLQWHHRALEVLAKDEPELLTAAPGDVPARL